MLLALGAAAGYFALTLTTTHSMVGACVLGGLPLAAGLAAAALETRHFGGKGGK